MLKTLQQWLGLAKNEEKGDVSSEAYQTILTDNAALRTYARSLEDQLCNTKYVSKRNIGTLLAHFGGEIKIKHQTADDIFNFDGDVSWEIVPSEDKEFVTIRLVMTPLEKQEEDACGVC